MAQCLAFLETALYPKEVQRVPTSDLSMILARLEARIAMSYVPTSSDLKLNRCQRGLKLLKPWYDDGRYLTLAQFIRYQSECGLLDVGSRRGDTLRTKQAAFRDEYRI